MPLYFFNLRFGQRAVVRDLADPKIGGNPRRWASWFVEVADEQCGFFRTPIGYPALELVTDDLLERRAEQPAPIRAPIRPAAFAPPDEAKAQAAEIVRETMARHVHTAQLLEVNQRLRNELGSVCRASEAIRVSTTQVLSLAQAAGDRH